MSGWFVLGVRVKIISPLSVGTLKVILRVHLLSYVDCSQVLHYYEKFSMFYSRNHWSGELNKFRYQ